MVLVVGIVFSDVESSAVVSVPCSKLAAAPLPSVQAILLVIEPALRKAFEENWEQDGLALFDDTFQNLVNSVAIVMVQDGCCWFDLRAAFTLLVYSFDQLATKQGKGLPLKIRVVRVSVAFSVQQAVSASFYWFEKKWSIVDTVSKRLFWTLIRSILLVGFPCGYCFRVLVSLDDMSELFDLETRIDIILIISPVKY
eukprot:3018888-Amphidinium_carterae.1